MSEVHPSHSGKVDMRLSMVSECQRGLAPAESKPEIPLEPVTPNSSLEV